MQCTEREADQFSIALSNHNIAIHKSAVEFSSRSDAAALNPQELSGQMGYWDNPGTGSLDLREKTVDKHIKTVFPACAPHWHYKTPFQYLGLTCLGF